MSLFNPNPLYLQGSITASLIESGSIQDSPGRTSVSNFFIFLAFVRLLDGAARF